MGNNDHYHKKGEEDGQKNHYNRPHGTADSLTTWTKGGMEKNRDENRAYDDGFFHSKGQNDGNNNQYRRPSDPDDRKAYDAGYDNARGNKKS